MKKIHLLSLLAITLFTVSSCSKEGPVGPAGSTGAQGATGATGIAGPAGAAGTANVIYSDWITPATYTKTTVFGTTTFTYNITEPKITQDILDKGTVVVFGKLNGYTPTIWPTDQVSIMPIVINYLQGTTPEIDTWSGLYSLGVVQISLKNNNNVYGGISNVHSFRYIIIPGGVKVSLATLNNYDALKEQLHMQD